MYKHVAKSKVLSCNHNPKISIQQCTKIYLILHLPELQTLLMEVLRDCNIYTLMCDATQNIHWFQERTYVLLKKKRKAHENKWEIKNIQEQSY
jgi:hypothetical protein